MDQADGPASDGSASAWIHDMRGVIDANSRRCSLKCQSLPTIRQAFAFGRINDNMIVQRMTNAQEGDARP